MNQYSSVVRWSDEDQCFIATCLEFEYVSAFGDTQEEALAELGVARQLVIEVMEEDGTPLPSPQKIEEYSGQFRARVPKSLHRSLAESAKQEGVSLNAYVISLLAERNAERRLLHICPLVGSRVVTIAETALPPEYPVVNTAYGEAEFLVSGVETDFRLLSHATKEQNH